VNPAVPNDKGAVVQRRPILKDAPDELSSYATVQRHTICQIFIYGLTALKRDNGSGA